MNSIKAKGQPISSGITESDQGKSALFNLIMPFRPQIAISHFASELHQRQGEGTLWLHLTASVKLHTHFCDEN